MLPSNDQSRERIFRKKGSVERLTGPTLRDASEELKMASVERLTVPRETSEDLGSKNNDLNYSNDGFKKIADFYVTENFNVSR